jgi:hypothetical protein
MQGKIRLPLFMDSPGPVKVREVIRRWRAPEGPLKFSGIPGCSGQFKFGESRNSGREKPVPLASLTSSLKSQKVLIGWLYAFIRFNVKRGRIFNLTEVLETGRADCLGYAKLFTWLGRECGLDAGVVEVIIDIRGAIVPHTTALTRLADGRLQFTDLWYGALNIRHRRLGLRVKEGHHWRVRDIDSAALKNGPGVSYLTDSCVDGITLYIEGNRFLQNREYPRAVEKYSAAIERYPENARIFYNRAIALENLGETTQAQADYSQALQDAPSLTRTLATQEEDIVGLMRLDEENIPETAQQAFLLHQGFITGRPESPAGISKKLGWTITAVKAGLASVEELLAKRP